MQASHATSSAPQGSVYQRRQPEQSTLYEVVRDNLQTLYAAIDDGFASPLPAFVRDEFERYLAAARCAEASRYSRVSNVTSND